MAQERKQMTQELHAKRDISQIPEKKSDHWEFFDPGTIPWTPWCLPKTHFKLLHVNDNTGGLTLLLKVDPGAGLLPIHKHLGDAEAFIVEGEFGYGAERGKAGWFAYEAGGANHAPDVPNGLLLFAVLHGPILGYNPDGSLSACIDIDWHYEMARNNQAADHIRRYFQYTTVG